MWDPYTNWKVPRVSRVTIFVSDMLDKHCNVAMGGRVTGLNSWSLIWICKIAQSRRLSKHSTPFADEDSVGEERE